MSPPPNQLSLQPLPPAIVLPPYLTPEPKCGISALVNVCLSEPPFAPALYLSPHASKKTSFICSQVPPNLMLGFSFFVEINKSPISYIPCTFPPTDSSYF